MNMRARARSAARAAIGFMAPWLLAIAALAAAGPAAGQTTTLTGTVTDQDGGRPVRDITVEAVGTRLVTRTDAQGRYSLVGLPAGSVTVRFSWLGYESREMVVDVLDGAARTLDVALTARPIPLGDIRVTAVARRPQRVVESPAAVSMVAPGRVADLASTDQSALLIADLPGVQVAQGGLNNFYVNPRSFAGLANRRLLVLVDGRDVAANFANSPEWAAFSLLEPATEIELIRGPGSALYGANAFSGVLDVRTPSIRQSRGARVVVGGGELSSYNLNARYGFVSDDLRWGLRTSGGYSRSRGFDRSRTNLGDLAEEYSEAAEGSVNVPQPGYELVALRGQTKEGPYGLPGSVTGEPDPQETTRGELRIERYRTSGGVLTAEGGITRIDHQVSATGASRVQIGRSTVPWARLAWDEEEFSLMAYYGGRSGTARDLASGIDYEDVSARLHLEGQANRSFSDERIRVVFGGSVRSESVDSKGTILGPEHDGRRDEYYGLFGQAEVALADQVDVSVVGRYDDASLFDAQFAPRIALVWTPGQRHSLRGTFGRAYLVPSVAQLFVRAALGPPLDLRAVEQGLRASPLGPALAGVEQGTLLTRSDAVPLLAIGNPTNDPESVEALELGYKGELGRAFVTVDVHRSEFDHFVTTLLPGVHPGFRPWTAPASVPLAARSALETALLSTLSGLTRLENGATAIVYSRSNAGRATQWGFDVAAGVQVTDQLRVDANYSHLDIDIDDESFLGTPQAPNTPESMAHLSMVYARPDGLRARVGLSVVDSFAFQDGVWEGTVPSRQSVDVSAQRPLGQDFSLALSVTNLFDQQRFQYYGGSIIGRRIMASATWTP